MEEKAIVISESVQLGAIQASSPDDVVKRASGVATALSDIINRKKLFTIINGKKYVQVDGWATLGAMLGILPREVKSEKTENGYESYVELIRTTDEMKVGGASAICTRDEKNWSNRDEYAIKSMATTRATGKAYRIAFSWIMNLAGYESTPAEEMIDADFVEVEKTKSKKQSTKKSEPNGNARSWDGKIIKAILDNQLADNAPNACNILNMSNLPKSPTVEQAVLWAKVYRKRREEKLEPAEAAGVANQEWKG